jgi:tetratricopeptide (TPR) repeat protein
MAYLDLGGCYFTLAQLERSRDYVRKAYELRDRVSEPEKLSIVSIYQMRVTGDLEAARKTYELFARIYPRSDDAAGGLGFTYWLLGDYDKALAEYQRASQLNTGTLFYNNLAGQYLALDRPQEAKAVAQRAQAINFNSPYLHTILYRVAFVEHDAAGMKREAEEGMPGYEDLDLYHQSNTAAYAGKLAEAEALTKRALFYAKRANKKETVAIAHAAVSLRAALTGNVSLAKRHAREALALSDGRDVEVFAAMGLGLAGDSQFANRLAADLAKRYPEDTVVQSANLPAIRALVTLGNKEGLKNIDKSIEALAAALPYERGGLVRLYPAYVRGSAYLAAHQGPAAAAEFQKILNHPGIVTNEIIGALAHLQLGRAYALSGDTAKAKTAYQDFLTLWKDADPDIPLLKQARTEYAKLQ